MNDREVRRYEMLERVQTFGKDNAGDFPGEGTAAAHFAALEKIITQLVAAKAGQKPGSGTAKEVLLDSLRIDMRNVARTANAIAQDEPGFADAFQLPSSPSEAALLTVADAFLVELKEPGVADKFIAHELPTDFVQHLSDDRAAIAAAQRSQESAREGGVANTAAVDRLIGEGMKEVTYLDAILHNKYTRDTDKLRAWESASHVERARQREKQPAPASAPAAPEAQPAAA